MPPVAAPAPATPSFRIAGVRLDAVDLPSAVEIVTQWIATRRREYVVFQGAHGIVEALDNPELRRIDEAAGLVAPDGMPGVWIGRWKRHRGIGRVYGPDFLLAVAARGVELGWRHYFYGGAGGVAERLARSLEQRFPGLRVAGTLAPPFRPLDDQEARAVAERINESGADLVWVGLGCPKQDFWMHRFRPLLAAPVLLGVGAAFDFHSGATRMAPRWIQRAGLEWSFRLLTEPRRLWPRYSRVVPRYAGLLLRELSRGRGPGAPA